MLEVRARVIEVNGNYADISPLGGGCGQCNSANGCGSGKLMQAFCSSELRTFLVLNQAGAQVGDEVTVALPDGMLLSSSWRIYMLPLLSMFFWGFIGSHLATDVPSQDGFAVAGAMLGLLLGFILAKQFSKTSISQAVLHSIIKS